MKKDSKQESFFWGDLVADEVIKRKRKKNYVVESGISPSGTIHFGNFREIMTVDLVKRSLEDKGKSVKFIYAWDDFDRLRKVPNNVPKEFEKYIGMPYCWIPDPFGCHKTYAEHFEKEFEESLNPVGIKPEFIRQHEKYENCEYAEEIKVAMNARAAIKAILDKYREHNLEKSWYPLSIYCEKCKKDSTSVTEYDGEYTVSYKCKCDHKDTIDFRKKGIVKLPWRVDWPMRWNHNNVDFEPGGKEHSTPGGSITTAQEIIKEVWAKEPPVYKKYEFIILKGVGGKMSGSLGNIISLTEVLEVYEPEMVRWMFAGTRPSAEFFVSFDLDVIKNYEDFDRLERMYYGKEEAKNEKEKEKNKRIYEVSCIGQASKKMPIRIAFRHLINLLQIHNKDIEKVITIEELEKGANLDKLRTRAKCALNWLEKYAPEEFKFEIQEKLHPELKLTPTHKGALNDVADFLEKTKKPGEKQLFEEFYNITQKHGISPAEFFEVGYLVLLNKKRGPKLANFILTLGREKVIEMFREAGK